MNKELMDLIDKSVILINMNVDGNYLAQASVDIGGFGWELRGFLIGESNNSFWCTAPYAKVKNPGINSKYVFHMEEDCWKCLHDKIIHEYTRQRVE